MIQIKYDPDDPTQFQCCSVPIEFNDFLHLFQIELGFLMVGHTHEDVDQRFSRLSQYLSKNSASTIAGKYVYTVVNLMLLIYLQQ